MKPIEIPSDKADRALITSVESRRLIRTLQRTVHDLRQCEVRPGWARFNGIGRLFPTVVRHAGFSSLRKASEGS